MPDPLPVVELLAALRVGIGSVDWLDGRLWTVLGLGRLGSSSRFFHGDVGRLAQCHRAGTLLGHPDLEKTELQGPFSGFGTVRPS
eukprot:5942028-Prymnesium_polylepis.1